MNIVVCVKQVPDTAHLKFGDGDTVIQEGVENILNPFCEYAIETAIRLKEAHEGSKITVLTMGAPQAKEALKKALAMGCDEAYLVSDENFSGADSWATAYTLTAAIRKYVPDFNVVLFGQFALDGASGMTGPQVAEFLNIPSITFCKQVELTGNSLKVHRETDKGVEIYEMMLPGLLCMMKCDYEPRMPSIKGVMKANRTEIPVVDIAGLGLTVEQVGFKGSPTMVAKTWRKPKKQGGVKVDGSDPAAAIQQLIGYLQEQKIL